MTAPTGTAPPGTGPTGTAPAGTHISGVLHERRRFEPPAAFAARARLHAEQLAALHERARHDYIGFWREQAEGVLNWHKPFTITLDEHEAPNYRWFCDGELNVSH